MAVNDMYRVEVLQNVGSEPTMNVLHLRESTAETGIQIVAEGVVSVVQGLYLNFASWASEDWSVISMVARLVSPAPGIPFTKVFGGADTITGAIASEIVPSQAATLISLYTNTADRTGRGRIYFPGTPESAQNEGQLTAAAWGALTGLIQSDLQDPQAASTVGATGIYRFAVHGGGGSPTNAWDVQYALVRPNLATQKRRRAFPGFGA